MVAPLWWKQRRFGLMVQANLATVPGVGPDRQPTRVGTRRTSTPGDSDVLLHPSPLVETLAHHARPLGARRATTTDFLPFLTFDDFDPDAWTGARPRCRDGVRGHGRQTPRRPVLVGCSGDRPDRDRRRSGPQRAGRVRRRLRARRPRLRHLTTPCSTGRDDRYPNCDYVESVVHPQVLDLVARYGSRMLWGDGHWGAGGDHWRSDELIAAGACDRPRHRGQRPVVGRWRSACGRTSTASPTRSRRRRSRCAAASARRHRAQRNESARPPADRRSRSSPS